jgi:glycosyltransferase involved in cell wall biosynthesis
MTPSKKTEFILFVTQINPNKPGGGSSVVLKNLITKLSSSNYFVAYLDYFRFRFVKENKYDTNSVFRVIPNWHPIYLIDFIFKGTRDKYIIQKLYKFVIKNNISILVGIYPTYKSIKISLLVAQKAKIKFFPYLHDTIADGLSHTNFAKSSEALEYEIIKTAKKVITISDGMKEYYDRKYSIQTATLEHSYPEEIVPYKLQRDLRAFWGGEIYNINDISFSRIQNALGTLQIPFHVTSLAKINTPLIPNTKLKYFEKRSDYINAVKGSQILILALNWPDETSTHYNELSTIFPTKTIEYLASGALIIAHCPSEYFLAKFLLKHNCGIVFSNRDENEISNKIVELLSNKTEIERLCENALIAAKIFESTNIISKFNKIINEN